MAYNRYRKRHYNISKTKARDYAESMNDLFEAFNTQYKDWEISTMGDSCYKALTSNIEIRISNHSADNQYHDLHKEGRLLINIKGSKLDFTRIIDTKVPQVLALLNKVNLEPYRFINVVGNRVHLFYRGYKTKKDTLVIPELS